MYVDAAAPDVGETNGSLSGADSVLKQKPESELFDKLPYPGAPAGAVDLYLKKDVFLQNFGNDLPADAATRLWATQRTASTARVRNAVEVRRLEDHSCRGTSSAAATRSSRPLRRGPWRPRAHSQVTVFDGGSHLTLISHPDAVTAVIDQAIDSVH